MKPDIIVTWPRNCDYPLWRQFIRDNRLKFNEIIIVFMETNQGEDYRQFVRDAMFADHALCIDSPPYANQDWRNVAVNAGLQYSLHSEWIWFTEQDFFPKTGFFEEVESYKDHDYIGITEGDRLHPCCLFIKRESLHKTRKNFGIIPNVSDHFSMIANDLKDMNLNGALLSPEFYTHMSGLSHNITLLARGEAPNWKPDLFKKYLEMCKNVTVPQDPRFSALYSMI